MKILLLGLLCLLVDLPACQAQDKATLPYSRLYDAFQRGARVQSSAVHAAIAVASKDKTVRPETITFTIESKGGARKLHVDPDGEIHGFPMNDRLLKENPSVVTNQPKGSLLIGGGLFFNVRASTAYSYRKLSDLLDASNAARKKEAGLFSLVAPQAKSVLFVFFDPAGQTLTVQTKTAPQTLTVNAQGEIALPIDKALLAANPRVRLSEKPSKVLPDL